MVVGRLGRPHGLRGHLRVSTAGRALRTLPLPISVVLRSGSGARRAEVVEVAVDGERLVILTSEASDREGAAALTGQELLLARADLPSLADPDEFYVVDLLGFDVESGGTRVGRLVDVLDRPANDVLEVEAVDGRIALIPFVAEAVREVAHERRAIVLEDWAFREAE